MTTKAPIASNRPLLQIIRKPALRERLGGCSDHHIDSLEAREGFPRHIRIGGRSVGWIEHEVDAWIERRMCERDQDPLELRAPLADREHTGDVWNDAPA